LIPLPGGVHEKQVEAGVFALEDLWEVEWPVEELLLCGNALHLFQEWGMFFQAAGPNGAQHLLCGCVHAWLGRLGGMGQKKAAVQVSAPQRACWYSCERR
jgi:hypothetical protein